MSTKEEIFQLNVKKAIGLVYKLEPERKRYFSPLPHGDEKGWTHLYSVFKHCFYYDYPNYDLLIASILHDILEDTSCDEQYLRDEFGDKVVEIVLLCTKKKDFDPADMDHQKEYFEKILNYPDKEVKYAAMSIKWADRLDNLIGASFIDDQNIITRYYKETQEWYILISKELGREGPIQRELDYVGRLIE